MLTFHETYHAYHPVLRCFLERPVHAAISRDNLKTYEHALGCAGRSPDWTRDLASGAGECCVNFGLTRRW
ncbi:hypothetical protein BZL30_4830 [Mycobacterium kansasii]|uniref:Uncharacterized protein n=1 Tax=Mycobacterium kansasii TaxID=1768 RepID=A0A1V3X409_MYCKA|nr:hypothetical protein BZL30_4830 [Mycobacterium kansasii]